MSRNRYIVTVIFFTALALPLYAKVTSTPDAQKAREVWGQIFHNKPVINILDDRTLINMWLLSGQDGIGADARSIAIADVMARQTGTRALRSSICPVAFNRRAEEMKRLPFTDKERQKLEALAKHASKDYYAWRPRGRGGVGIPMHATFALAAAVNLHETVKRHKTIEDAFRNIAREHGWICDLRKIPEISVEDIQESSRI